MSAPLDPQLRRELRGGKPAGVWFLHGDAARLRDDAARQLLELAVDPATRDFNFDSFDSADVTMERLGSALGAPPMMAERRGVWLRGVEQLPKSNQKELLRMASAVPGDVLLVITATIPKRSKAAFWGGLRRAGRALEWSAPRPAQLPAWVRARARDRWGVALSHPMARWISEVVTPDLSALDAELEKLSQVPDLDDGKIRELIPRTQRIARWAWLDLVASRRYAEARGHVDDILASETGVGLVAGLVEHHLLLGPALEGGERALRSFLRDARKGYLLWKAGQYARQARRWTGPELDRALGELFRADRHLKSGRSDAAVLGDLLLALEGARA